MRQALERCWTAMRADNACYIAERYDHTLAPAGQLTSGDGWCMLVSDAVEDAIHNGHPSLADHVRSQRPQWDAEDDDDEPSDEFWQRQQQYEDRVQRAIGLDFRTNPTHIAHWAAACGSCHWFNRHIGLHLAARVCPDVEWRVVSGCDHTTVVSVDGRGVFDLLAWGYDRLRPYVMGEEWVETDPTLGGAAAVDRARKRCQGVDCDG